MKFTHLRTTGAAALLAASMLALTACGGGGNSNGQGSVASSAYAVTHLVSNDGATAAHQDKNLVNPLGIAFNPTGFVWVSNSGSSTATLYDGNGVLNALVVNTAAAPTGIVFYGGTTGFSISGTSATGGAVSGASRFIFATDKGQIAAWAPNVALTTTTVTFDGGSAGRSYKGLAIATQGTTTLLYATDFRNARVDVFDSNFKPVNPGGSFADPSVPIGYAPFGIQAIGNRIFVTYAQQDSTGTNSVSGEGLGRVSVYDLTGALVSSFAGGGALNAPWGVAQAPANFGAYSNAILVGNVGDGTVNAYSSSGDYLGALRDPSGAVIRTEGLGGLAFGNGLNSQPLNTLFLTAGPGRGLRGAYDRIDAR